MTSKIKFGLLGLALCLTSFSAHAETALNDSQRQEVEKLVRETLMKNPEIIMQAIEVLRERQAKAEEESRMKSIISLKDKLENTPFSPVAGNPKGDVTIVEFFDYNCTYCKRSLPMVMELLKADPNIRYVFKEFPILAETSQIAARAALAAQVQGKYFDFHRMMMEAGGGITEDKIYKVAEKVGINVAKLKEDMKDPRIDEELKANYALTRELDISGTPAFIVGEEMIPGMPSPGSLEEAINKVRKSQKKS